MVLPRVKERFLVVWRVRLFRKSFDLFSFFEWGFILNHWQLHFMTVCLNIFLPVDLCVFILSLPNFHSEFQIQMNLKSQQETLTFPLDSWQTHKFHMISMQDYNQSQVYFWKGGMNLNEHFHKAIQGAESVSGCLKPAHTYGVCVCFIMFECQELVPLP